MKESLRQALLILLLSILGMGGTWLGHPNLPPWNPMTLEEDEIDLEGALALENILWLDARGESAYLEDHIPGALLLNEDNWNEHFEAFIQVWDGLSALVVYCDSRTCAASKSVADHLKEDLGIEEIFVLKGGWQTWLKKVK